VFHFFEEITQIPHGSGNVKMISDYLKKFADDRGLKCIQDEALNIIIQQPASEGYENEEPMILQGHMDMVAVHDADHNVDMKSDPLDVAVDGDYVYAKGTSLGGDDGIAVAYMLAILDDKEIMHPELYCVITVNEETGMDGAAALDMSPVKAKRLLNLDSEDEGEFLVSCAGGCRAYCRLSLSFEKKEGTVYKLKIDGLLGGHSGDVIDKGRANANCLMGRAMTDLISQGIDCSAAAVNGGVADNAIPRSAEAVFVVAENDEHRFTDTLVKCEKSCREEFGEKDKNISFSVKKVGKSAFDNSDDKGDFTTLKEACGTDIAMKDGEILVMKKDCFARAAHMIIAFPSGVQAMSEEIKGLVETSLNLGMLTMDDKSITALFLVRSSVEAAKQSLLTRVKAVCTLAGADMTTSGEYPGWQFKKDSTLREKMISVYEKMYGKKPVVHAIHAGVECGLLLGKKPDLDCVSIGPDMLDIHTANEKLSISSTKRVWEFVTELLREKG
jgi:dipeptidase D